MQLSVVTDGFEGERLCLAANNPVGEGRHTMRVHSHATDKSSLGNKAPNPNNSATRCYSLTAFSVPLLPRPQALAETRSERWWWAELQRLRGVFLATIGANETQIQASFCQAISTAREQKSISLEKRAEASYAEYRRQKASAPGGRGFRLPLC
jgi:hypothetical protein